MDKNQFWDLIEEVREKAGNWQSMMEPFRESLRKLNCEEILQFYRIFDKYLYLADKGHILSAAILIRNGISDGGFLYFRKWLIAQGKDAYLSALANPDSLGELPSIQKFAEEKNESFYMPIDGYVEAPTFELFGYVPIHVYGEKEPNADFYDELQKSALSQDELDSITSEVIYPHDCDLWTEDMEVLGATFPSLKYTLDSMDKINRIVDCLVELDINRPEDFGKIPAGIASTEFLETNRYEIEDVLAARGNVQNREESASDLKASNDIAGKHVYKSLFGQLCKMREEIDQEPKPHNPRDGTKNEPAR